MIKFVNELHFISELSFFVIGILLLIIWWTSLAFHRVASIIISGRVNILATITAIAGFAAPLYFVLGVYPNESTIPLNISNESIILYGITTFVSSLICGIMLKNVLVTTYEHYLCWGADKVNYPPSNFKSLGKLLILALILICVSHSYLILLSLQ